MLKQMECIHVIDSHTGGEPTRIIISGGPTISAGSMGARLEAFKLHHDCLRRALVNEPRGSNITVGAWLSDPISEGSAAGVIFFNNVGYLGMCVHGTIGLMATLVYLKKIKPGHHRIDTPVGTVSATLSTTGEISVANVPSRRIAKGVAIRVSGYGNVQGDVAWGGNWFFLVNEHPYELILDNVEELTQFAWAIRLALAKSGIRGSDGKEIDHIELFGPSKTPGVNSKNFVLCPGKAYDRSPCGTGTSAKLACLYADGLLRPGEVWRQESIVGSVFEGHVEVHAGEVIPIIKGSAFITADSDVLFDQEDSFRFGIEA